MPESEVTVEFSKKKKRNEEEEGQDQVLSFRELKSYFDKKIEDINEKCYLETKHLAKRLKKASGSILHPITNVIEFNMSSI